MSDCLGPLNHSICEIFLDDVIIFSETFEQHIDRLTQVFQCFRNCNLKLSPKKCHLFRSKVKYVGHIVSVDGIHTDPDKISRIQSWPIPTNINELRVYLGFAGYYRRFVRNFSKIAKPLNDLLGGKVQKSKRKGKTKRIVHSEWKWGDSEQKAFDELRYYLTSPPILSYPDYSKPFILHTDASIAGLGSVLYQVTDGKEHVIAYASRGLTKAERNYHSHKLEFLALKWAVTQKFHDYLYGSNFVVYTDNNPLTYILTSAKLDATGHRWVAALAAYNFSLKYRSGKENSDADALSRLPGLSTDTSEYKEITPEVLNVICHNCRPLPYMDTISMSMIPVDDDTVSMENLNPSEWRSRQRSDPIIGLFSRSVTQKEKPPLDSITTTEGKSILKEFDHLVIRRGVLYRQVKDEDEESLQLVLPSSWRTDAMKGAHDELGHFGHARGIAVLRQRFYWPHMSADLTDWIKRCERCIKRKSPTSTAPLVSISTTQPLELVCMDFLSLETSKGGFECILVITDHFTRYACAFPTRNMTAKTTADILFNNYIIHYGFPQRIHSDQGPNFESKLIRELCTLSGMVKSRTTPYHAAGNGMTERFNQTLLGMLGTLEPSKKCDWKSYVGPLVACIQLYQT